MTNKFDKFLSDELKKNTNQFKYYLEDLLNNSEFRDEWVKTYSKTGGENGSTKLERLDQATPHEILVDKYIKCPTILVEKLCGEYHNNYFNCGLGDILAFYKYGIDLKVSRVPNYKFATISKDSINYFTGFYLFMAKDAKELRFFHSDIIRYMIENGHLYFHERKIYSTDWLLQVDQYFWKDYVISLKVGD